MRHTTPCANLGLHTCDFEPALFGIVLLEGFSLLRRRLEALHSDVAIDIALQLAAMPNEAAENVQLALLSWLQGRAAALNSRQHSALNALRLSRHVPQPWRDRLTHLLGEQSLS